MKFGSQFSPSLSRSATCSQEIRSKLAGILSEPHSPARVRVRVSQERGFLSGPIGLSPSIMKYMIAFPILDHNSVFSTASLRQKLSPIYGSLRFITTWGSVNEQEAIKAFEKYTSSIDDKTVSQKEIYNMYIESLLRTGNLVDAVYCFYYLHNRQIKMGLSTYNLLLNAAGEANNFHLFAEIFKKLLLSGQPPDFTSYVHVAKSFQNLADSALLLRFIRELLDITRHRDPIVMNRIIFITGKSGLLDKCLLIFEELKNSNAKMDTVTFNTVIVMLGRAGRFEEMVYEFNTMKDLGHTPNIITFNTLINCLRRLGRLYMCKSFAKEMVERGIELDLRTYTALIDAFGRAGHVEDAMRLFHEMKKSHRPSIYVYRAMISNLKKAGRFEVALNLLEEMNSSTLKLIGPEDFKREKKRSYRWKVRLGSS